MNTPNIKVLIRKNILLLILFLSFQNSFAQNGIINLQSNSGYKTIVDNNEQLTFVLNFDKIESKYVSTEEGGFNEITIPQIYTIGDPGNPQLPAYKKLIIIPQGTFPEIKVNSFSEKEYVLNEYGINNKLFPAQTDYAKNDTASQKFYYNPKAYTEKTYSEESIARIEILGSMRGRKIARITVVPVKYDAPSGKIKVYNNINVQVKFNPDVSKTSESVSGKHYSTYFEPIFSKIGAKSYEKGFIEASKIPAKFLIVSDSSYRESLKSFIDWKIKKGFDVIVGYNDKIGKTQFDIESWIKAEYNKGLETDNAPVFLLIVGDVNKIPAYKGEFTNSVTDLYYASVDGDMFPEMYYGRFSVSTVTELNSVIEKTIDYEKYSFEKPDFLNKATLIAGVDEAYNPKLGKPTMEFATRNFFNSSNGYKVVNKYVSSYNDCYAPENIAVGFINYTAHALRTMWQSPALNNDDVGKFSNNNSYPFVIGNCCLSGDFGTDICFGEAWLRKNKGGAVAYIGSAPNSWWLDDFYWSVGAFEMQGENDGFVPVLSQTTSGAYRAMFDKGYMNTSSIVFSGNLAVTEANVNGYNQDSSPEYYWEAYNLLGDPSLVPYFTQAKEITEVKYADAISMGATFFDVKAEAGSYISISMNGVILGVGFADESSNARIYVSPVYTVGEIDLVITKPQRIPVITKIPVVVLYGAFIIRDGLEIKELTESGNGKAGNGELVELIISLKNIGNQQAKDIITSLSSDSKYIESISNNTSIKYPDIDPGSKSPSSGSFIIKLADYVPDQERISFNFSIKTQNQVENVYNFSILVDAPSPAITFVKVDDKNLGVLFISVPNTDIIPKTDYEYNILVESLGGNNNSLLDAGENTSLFVNVSNQGHSDMSLTTCELKCESKYVTIKTNPIQVGVLAVGNTQQKEFEIHIDSNTPKGEFVEFDFIVKSGEYEKHQIIIRKVGLSLEDFETGNLNQYNWENSGAKPWVITDKNTLSGSYSLVSGSITDGQSSGFKISMDVLENDTIKFNAQISTEKDWDYFRFYINGIVQIKLSGNISNEQYLYPVKKGRNTFMWEFVKDDAQSGGADRVWLDDIVLPGFKDENQVKNIIITAKKTPEWLSLNQTGNGTALLKGTIPDTVGKFEVDLIATNGQKEGEQNFYINVGGLDVKEDFTNSLNIYPNPVSDKIIATFSEYGVKKIKILDIYGKIIFETETQDLIFNKDISMLANGTYIIEISTKSKTIAKKIVLQH